MCRLVDLVVQPEDEPEGFNPKRHNWRRSAKVPILVINATTLNTGHNWQFTATWIGEPPSAVERKVDVARSLPRMWLRDEAPAAHTDIALEHRRRRIRVRAWRLSSRRPRRSVQGDPRASR